jgi:hypothetical protein
MASTQRSGTEQECTLRQVRISTGEKCLLHNMEHHFTSRFASLKSITLWKGGTPGFWRGVNPELQGRRRCFRLRFSLVPVKGRTLTS